MLSGALIVVLSFAYVGLLFAIAYWGDKRADAGRSLIANPYIYTLSLAVYCTSWTFYGSVGRAATSGIGFLPIYLGPWARRAPASPPPSPPRWRMAAAWRRPSTELRPAPPAGSRPAEAERQAIGRRRLGPLANRRAGSPMGAHGRRTPG